MDQRLGVVGPPGVPVKLGRIFRRFGTFGLGVHKVKPLNP